MRNTLASTCPEFREVRTSTPGGQSVWTAFVFFGYLLAPFLPEIAALIASEPAHENPLPATGIVLVAPVSKTYGGQARCFSGCNSSTRPRVRAIKLDRNGVKLGIVDDASFEILKVLRRVHGLIAFAPPDQSRYAAHLFDASGTPVQGEESTAIDDYFTLLLPEVTQWPELHRLAESHNIDRSEIVYVLFPAAYWNVVADSIRKEAQNRALSGSISEATLRFDATAPSGVRVEYVGADHLGQPQ